MLLTYENPRLLTNDDMQTCRNQNQIKTKPKISTRDNILRMNKKDMNSGCSEMPKLLANP